MILLIESNLNIVLLSTAIEHMVNHNQHMFEINQIIRDSSSVNGWNFGLNCSNSDN